MGKELLKENIISRILQLIFSGKAQKVEKLVAKDEELVNATKKLDQQVNIYKSKIKDYLDEYGE